MKEMTLGHILRNIEELMPKPDLSERQMQYATVAHYFASDESYVITAHWRIVADQRQYCTFTRVIFESAEIEIHEGLSIHRRTYPQKPVKVTFRK